MRLKNRFEGFFGYILGVGFFLILVGSVNYISLMYWSAFVLLICSLLYMPVLEKPFNLIKSEKLLLLFLVAYPGFTALNVYLRGGGWPEFQEASRFLLIIPVIMAVRQHGVGFNWLRWGILIGAVVAGFWGYYHKEVVGLYRAYGGTNDLQSAFGNISLLLGMMSIVVFYDKWRSSHLWKIVVIVGFCFGMYASVASLNKGGWISLPFMILLVLSLDPAMKVRYKVGVIVSAAVGAVLVYSFSASVQQRVDVIFPAIYTYFTTGEVFDGSVGARLALWHTSWLIFIDNPFFGVGMGTSTFKAAAAPYVELDPNLKFALTTGPHSQFFLSIVRFGIIGPVLVFGIYFALIRLFVSHLKVNRQLAILGLMLAVGFMDFGLVEFVWARNNFGVFFTFVVAAIVGQLAYLRRSGENQLN